MIHFWKPFNSSKVEPKVQGLSIILKLVELLVAIFASKVFAVNKTFMVLKLFQSLAILDDLLHKNLRSI